LIFLRMKNNNQDESFNSLMGQKLLECKQAIVEIESEIMTLNEVASLIGVTRRTVYTFRKELKLPFAQIGGKNIFFRSEVLKTIGNIKIRARNEKSDK